jgi:3-deoxy-D-manno-octulosonic-acid transferase
MLWQHCPAGCGLEDITGRKMRGLFIYNIIVFIFLLIGLPILLPLALLSEKRRKTVWHRLGISQPETRAAMPELDDSAPKPIWVHALSVGEVLSAEPLLWGLKKRFPNRPLFLTVSTQTGYEIAQKQFKALVAAIRFFPFDLPFSVKRVVRSIDPALVFIVETDIWPNFLAELQKRSIPVFLVNARLSERSLRGYKRLSFFFRPVFSVFARICVQSGLDAGRFARLGIAPDRIYLSGNIKFDRKRATLSPERLSMLRGKLAIYPNQPVIVAGSTHEGEEKILLKGVCRLKKQWPSLLIILAPRDPKRAMPVSRLAKSLGLENVTLSSIKKSQPPPPMDVIVVDEMGMLRDLYAIADIAFVGGSLVPCSGHNPLEPAAYGKPILFGPDMRDFSSISRSLEMAGGAIRIQNAGSFCQTTNQLLSSAQELKTMGENALNLFQANGGAVEKTLAAAAGWL